MDPGYTDNNSLVVRKQHRAVERVLSFLTKKPLEERFRLITTSMSKEDKQVEIELKSNEFGKALEEAKFLLNLKRAAQEPKIG